MRVAIAPEAAELVARYPAISGCTFVLEPFDGGDWNARIEVLLPQHQLIVNATGTDEAGARRRALARAAERLEQGVKRDPRLREGEIRHGTAIATGCKTVSMEAQWRLRTGRPRSCAIFWRRGGPRCSPSCARTPSARASSRTPSTPEPRPTRATSRWRR